MAIPTIWKDYSKNTADEILREYFEPHEIKAPIPIKEIIESYLGDVQYLVTIDKKFPDNISAFATKDPIFGWIIMVDGREPVVRQRFSSAHELAHVALFKNNSKIEYCSKDKRSWVEQVCDRFAGHLLMPEVLVRHLYITNSKPKLEDIAKVFKVSTMVAKIQLELLGLPFIGTVSPWI